MKPRVRAAPPGAARASTSCSRSAQPPSSAATSSAVPTNVLTRESRAANWAWSRLTAQPATSTSRAVLRDRRTDWRDLASASLVMQHVLMTWRSASASATSVCPAASMAWRASMASACETLQPRNLTANEATSEDGIPLAIGARSYL